jgi:multimeric flavodoxin WrbA
VKIIAINGSHRGRNGYTHFLINKLFEGAVKAGAQCETIVLAEKKIKPCLGCHVCQSENSYLKCVYNDKDDVTDLFNKIRESDIIIFATPIYIFTMSGLLKTFLERMASTADSSIRTVSKSGLLFHNIDTGLFSKPFVLLTCQDNMEDETYNSVVTYFKTFSRFMDAPMVGTLNRKSSSLAEKGKDKIKEDNFPGIIKIYEQISKAGEELAIKGRITAKTQKLSNQNIIQIPGISTD